MTAGFMLTDGSREQLAIRVSIRELEVIRAAARGLSNMEISAGLFLAEATVKSHIAWIVAKLDLRDRAQIVVFAYESGLVRAGHARRPD